MTYRIVVLEDEEIHRKKIHSLLESYQQKNTSIRFEITYYSNSYRLRADYSCNADLLFMDIQMEGMNGIQTAKEIRKIDSKVMIIFTTALAQYAIEGYSVQAFDFILKPLEESIFDAKLDLALNVLEHTHIEKWLDISNRAGTRRVAVSDILYIEVDSHNILVHTKTDVIRCWGSLKEFEEKLSRLHFVRCNACYLVNLRHVRAIGGNTVQVGQKELSVSKAKYKEFLVAFAMYKGGTT